MFQRTISVILLTLALLVTSGCYGDMLNAQRAKDRDLGNMTQENLRTSNHFRDNIVSFEFSGEPGKYICNVKDIADGQAAGRFGYNAMVVLDERNNTKVKTGRDLFIIEGRQSGTVIFEVRFGVGILRPEVTLKGPYEGEVYEPN